MVGISGGVGGIIFAKFDLSISILKMCFSHCRNDKSVGSAVRTGIREDYSAIREYHSGKWSAQRTQRVVVTGAIVGLKLTRHLR